MPIAFQCSSCHQILSISRKKAGHVVTCPSCLERLIVPVESEVEEQEIQPVAGLEAGAPPSQVIEVPESADEDDEVRGIQLKRRPFDESGLDMTPMVDVVFQLLIFFMMTAAFDLQKSLPTSVPGPDSEGVSRTVTIDDVRENSVIVSINDQDQIAVDDKPVADLAELRDVLASKISSEKKTEMLIEASYRSSHGINTQVTDIGIDVGMQAIRQSRQGSD